MADMYTWTKAGAADKAAEFRRSHLLEKRHASHVSALMATVFCVVSLGGGALASDYETGYPGSTRDHGKSLSVGDPISAANGAYHFQMDLLSLGGPLDLGFTLFYRSDMGRVFHFLPETFWWQPFARTQAGFTINSEEYATVYPPNGDQVSFKKNPDGNWELTGPEVTLWGYTYRDNRPQRKCSLVETEHYFYLQDPFLQQVFIFYIYDGTAPNSRSGRIAAIMDRNGNRLAYTYMTDASSTPQRVEDGLGRSLDFTYELVNWQPILNSATDHADRQVTFEYEAEGEDNDDSTTLRSVTRANGQTVTFQYAGVIELNNLIASRTFPLENRPYQQTYGRRTVNGNAGFPRVIAQTDAYGKATTIAYEGDTNSVVVTDPDDTTAAYVHYSSHGLPKSLTDATGKTAQFAKNDQEDLTSTTDRLGDVTAFEYHAPTGKLATVTNAKGQLLSYTHTAQSQTFTNPFLDESVSFTFHNVTRIDYPDSTNEQFTYDAQGNLLTRTDQAGKTWSYTYDTEHHGELLTVTNPAGGVITRTYNADATLASETDTDLGVTTYAYDQLQRLTKLTHPDDTFVEIAYNQEDQVTSLKNENGQVYSYSYDANGNLVTVTDPDSHEARYTYDLLDRVSQVTDRLGKSTAFAYTDSGQLASITDAAGLQAVHSYDPRGWLNGVTRGSSQWLLGYDDEGVLASSTTPLGHTTTYLTDQLGYVASVTNALGHATTFARDAMAQVAEATDPLDRTTTYTYDGRGRLASVTPPAVGTATYQRDDLGGLMKMTDLNGSDWLFTQTSMGRPKSTTDPLGRTTQKTLDDRGRPAQVAFPDGATWTLTYDGTGALTRRLCSDGPDLGYTYNAIGGLVATNDLALTRDAENQVTDTVDGNLHFGATYRDNGQLATVSYGETLTVTYEYDAQTGLLTSVSDDLTDSRVSFTYDADFRLAGLTRSNGVNATFTWDDAARLTRTQDGEILDLQYTHDAAGQLTGVSGDRPLSPAGFNEEGAETLTCDAASQVSAAGYTHDQRGRLTASPGRTYQWNSLSELVKVDSASLTYNGLGELRTRQDGTDVVQYLRNHAIALAPIVAERDANQETFLRYYVWTPAGDLLYVIDAADGNAVRFYHFDHLGSTLALTNSEGQVTDAYAYTPYGRLSGHEGDSLQPFTFVGRLGVRQHDASGTLYDMRARYYDAGTGRFLSREPIWPDTVDPLLLNPYQYARHAPTLFTDPLGTNIWDTIDRAANAIGDAVDYAIGGTRHLASVEQYDRMEKYYEEVAARERGRYYLERAALLRRQIETGKLQKDIQLTIDLMRLGQHLERHAEEATSAKLVKGLLAERPVSETEKALLAMQALPRATDLSEKIVAAMATDAFVEDMRKARERAVQRAFLSSLSTRHAGCRAVPSKVSAIATRRQ